MILTVSASGSGHDALSYHWIKDGVALFNEMLPNCTGVDTSTLTITSFTAEHEGRYKCVVSSIAGSVESNTVKLTGKTLYIINCQYSCM